MESKENIKDQVVIRLLGDFEVHQRVSDNAYNATSLLKQWNKVNRSSIRMEEFYNDERDFLNDMSFDVGNNAVDDVYLPYHIFVVFAKWLSPYYFLYV